MPTDPEDLRRALTASLHQAIATDSVHDVKLMLWRGADPNARDAGGQPALDQALGLQRSGIVDVLLDHGARLAGVGRAGEPLPAAWLLFSDRDRMRAVPLRPPGVVIGRDPSRCDVALADFGISRCHARIEVRPDGSMALTDLKSKGGSQVNGVPVVEAALAPGDRLMLGKVRFAVVPSMSGMPDDAARPGPAMVTDLAVRLGPPVDGQCELVLEAAGGTISVVFADGLRDSIEDLIAVVEGAAAGEAAHVFFWDGRLRQELRFVPRASEVSVEVWGGEGDPRLLFRVLSTVRAVGTAFWSALRDFAERAHDAPLRHQWSHWFPTRRMALLTRQVTGVKLPARPRSPGGHALVTYSLPDTTALDPRLAKILERRCLHSELVPATDVEDRRAAVRRLGADAEAGMLALFEGFFWFVSVPSDADDGRGKPNSSGHQVASTEELEPILERGYTIEVWGGPYRLRAEAEDHLEALWDSHDTD